MMAMSSPHQRWTEFSTRCVWLILTGVLALGIAAAASIPSQAANVGNIGEMCPFMVHRVYEDHVPFGNLSAGNYTHIEGDTHLWPCVLSCCGRPQQQQQLVNGAGQPSAAASSSSTTCNVAFMVGDKCYHVACVSNEMCMPHKHVPAQPANATAADENLGDILRMVLVNPVAGDPTWPLALEQFTTAEQPAKRRPPQYAADESSAGVNRSPEAVIYDGGETLDDEQQMFDTLPPQQRPPNQLLRPCVFDLGGVGVGGIVSSSTSIEQQQQQLDADSCGANEECVPYSEEATALGRGVCDCFPAYVRRSRFGECVPRRRLLPLDGEFGGQMSADDDGMMMAADDSLALASDRRPDQVVAQKKPQPTSQQSLSLPSSSPTSTASAIVPIAGVAVEDQKPLTVSVLSKEVRLPEREVSLAAYTISDDPAGNAASQYKYLWSLISQPSGDVNGTMSDHTKDTIHLTNLSEGLYRFKVVVTEDRQPTQAAANTSGQQQQQRTGQAFANVTVVPQKRINQSPRVHITPDHQTVKLPTNKAILDGSTSTDDDRIVTWHWDLIQGPIGYRPQLDDVSTLQLSDLNAPGNYTFRLTLTDSDGAQNSSTACITVLRANDYPPEANAGGDVILYLPENRVTLNGSLSSDDREITTWEWTKVTATATNGGSNGGGDGDGGGGGGGGGEAAVSKAVDMQHTNTPYLQLSNLQEGIYAFELKVGDASNQTSTAQVHVFVKAALPSNRPPLVKASGGNRTIALPQTWAVLTATAEAASASADGVRYEWRQQSGPKAAVLVATTAVAAATAADDGHTVNATALTVGVYQFRVSAWTMAAGGGGAGVSNANTTDDIWVTVVQETNRPPVANAGGDQTFAMPVKEIRLNGSRSSDDLGIATWLWRRDDSSLAAGEVLAGSEKEMVMILTNIYPGRYVFRLTVTDAQGASSSDTASVIVHPDPQLQHLVELTLAVDVTRWTQAERVALQQRLLLLLGDGTRLQLRDMRPDRRLSEVILVFYVERQLNVDGATMSPAIPNANDANKWEPMPGRDVERRLAQRFWHEPNILGTTVTDVRTTLCQNPCSGHGTCVADTRACACDAFWMPDVFFFWGMADEANCNWSILYVVIGVFVLFLAISTCCWALMRLCRRSRSGGIGGGNGNGTLKKSLRKRLKPQKYSPLGTQDDEIPTLTQSATTLSESDTDSDVVFESSGRNKSRSGISVPMHRKHDVETGGKNRTNGMTRLGRRLRT